MDVAPERPDPDAGVERQSLEVEILGRLQRRLGGRGLRGARGWRGRGDPPVSESPPVPEGSMALLSFTADSEHRAPTSLHGHGLGARWMGAGWKLLDAVGVS